jgi:hypothetical protein
MSFRGASPACSPVPGPGGPEAPFTAYETGSELRVVGKAPRA